MQFFIFLILFLLNNCGMPLYDQSIIDKYNPIKNTNVLTEEKLIPTIPHKDYGQTEDLIKDYYPKGKDFGVTSKLIDFSFNVIPKDSTSDLTEGHLNFSKNSSFELDAPINKANVYVPIIDDVATKSNIYFWNT